MFFSCPKSRSSTAPPCTALECLKSEVVISIFAILSSDFSNDHSIIITQPRPLKISSTWEKRFDHLLEMGGRRFRVILFRRRTRVSIPCKEMIGVKRFLPVLIYRQISRDCILNQRPHWIVYHFLAGSLSSKIWSFNILISFRYIKMKEHYFQFVLFSPCGGLRVWGRWVSNANGRLTLGNDFKH